jgi:uncharacterized protein (TIGR00725 family)
VPLQVAVSGPADCTEEEARTARRLGELLARRGAVVLCGGRDAGVMGAVAAGARAAGGLAVGILPGRSRAGASKDLTVAVTTGLGEARNSVLVQAADALVVVGCSWGTLSELALGMRRGDLPVVVIGGWRLLHADGRPVEGPHRVASAEEAADLVFELLAPKVP